MEKFKDYVPLVTAVNTVGLVGVSAYTYKQFEKYELEFQKIQSTLSKIIQKLNETEKESNGVSDVIKTFNSDISDIKQGLDSVNESVYEIKEDMDETISSLQDTGVSIERPSQIPRRHGRSYDEYEPRRSNKQSKSRVSVRRMDEYRQPISHKSRQDDTDEEILNAVRAGV
jgi:chromosome segregation ATPase